MLTKQTMIFIYFALCISSVLASGQSENGKLKKPEENRVS